MQHAVPSCHIAVPFDGHVDPNVSTDTSLESQISERTFDYSAGQGSTLLVPAAHQETSTTAGRAVTDPYSWMQAVHWMYGAGAHKRFNVTTVRLAQILAELNPCRPGVEYLMRRLGLSERAVQYHLAALRETGLLVYISRGTRRRGQLPQASVFARTIPLSFDVALGIRCTQEGLTRRPVGIAEHGRKLIAKLGKKASRKIRKPRPKATSKTDARCTPMEGGPVLPSLTRSPTSVPLETSDGKREQPTGGKTDSGPKRVNTVGRRFQLALELKRRILWLAHAPAARIAWVVREVADAGWTVDEVEAWLYLRPAAAEISRSSGFLAARMAGAASIWADPKGRQHAVETSREHIRANARTRAAVEEDALAAPAVRGLAASVLASMRRGQAQRSARARAQGLDDPSGYIPVPVRAADLDNETDIAARFAAFLEGASL